MSNVVKKAFTKAGRAIGVIKKEPKNLGEAVRPVLDNQTEPAVSTVTERAEAARRRSRRGGRRALMYASRLGGGARRGTAAEEEQTTLGAG